jgi:hypothetical protein
MPKTCCSIEANLALKTLDLANLNFFENFQHFVPILVHRMEWLQRVARA